MQAEVIVVGSGLAGLACGFRLAQQKREVLLLEGRDVLGGRTSSWVEDGMAIDSGIHKFLGIYRTLPKLLRDAGVDTKKMLTWVDAMELHSREGRRAYFPTSPYKRPFSTLAGALRNNHFIPPLDKLRLAAMGSAALVHCAARPHSCDASSLLDRARRAGVSRRVCDDVLHTLTTGVWFIPVERTSTYAAISPVVEGVKRGMTLGIGAFNGGMTELMARPLAACIQREGGSVRTGVRVDRLLVENGRVTGVQCGDERLLARTVVLATPIEPARALLRDAFGEDPWLKPLFGLGTVSAVCLQCDLDRPLFETDHVHFSNTAMACFGEQSHTTFRQEAGRLSIIMYPPNGLLEADAGEVLARAEAAAEQMGLDLKGRVTRYRVVRHPREFYELSPGSEPARPDQETPVPGLVLAGDWTKQPFLASMEGAAISGVRAARVVARHAAAR